MIVLSSMAVKANWDKTLPMLRVYRANSYIEAL